MMHEPRRSVFPAALAKIAFVVLFLLDLRREFPPIALLIKLALAAVPDKLSKLFCCNHNLYNAETRPSGVPLLHIFQEHFIPHTGEVRQFGKK